MLKHIRENAGVTQKEVAEIGGMSTLAVHRYEQGIYQNPSSIYLAAFSQALEDHGAVDPNDNVYTPKLLSEIYHENRRHKKNIFASRIKNLGNFPVVAVDTIDIEGNHRHPYQQFIRLILKELEETPSLMRWCTLTCFHPAQLHRFMETRNVTVIPGAVGEFFSDSVNEGLSELISEYWRTH